MTHRYNLRSTISPRRATRAQRAPYARSTPIRTNPPRAARYNPGAPVQPFPSAPSVVEDDDATMTGGGDFTDDEDSTYSGSPDRSSSPARSEATSRVSEISEREVLDLLLAEDGMDEDDAPATPTRPRTPQPVAPFDPGSVVRTPRRRLQASPDRIGGHNIPIWGLGYGSPAGSVVVEQTNVFVPQGQSPVDAIEAGRQRAAEKRRADFTRIQKEQLAKMEERDKAYNAERRHALRKELDEMGHDTDMDDMPWPYGGGPQATAGEVNPLEDAAPTPRPALAGRGRVQAQNFSSYDEFLESLLEEAPGQHRTHRGNESSPSPPPPASLSAQSRVRTWFEHHSPLAQSRPAAEQPAAGPSTRPFLGTDRRQAAQPTRQQARVEVTLQAQALGPLGGDLISVATWHPGYRQHWLGPLELVEKMCNCCRRGNHGESEAAVQGQSDT
ncbi:hypothetical protein BV25DRAFT_224555 [Artomyces pyxidatus]|uniref:Uncharacterized protein n=1 Tax=Artomyces pyxidatus TaxID=48021 RepID=A0ACB8T9P1_9AGAM|nr:hypothetical protein BV25DRAFT_224555 [Artomyces pyxidatus]